MLFGILVLVLLLPVAFLSLALGVYTTTVLYEMSVYLEAPESAPEPTVAHTPRKERRVSQSTSLELHTLCR